MAWQVTEGLLSLMNREIQVRRKAFWIATLTSGIQVNPDDALRRSYLRRLGVDRLDYPDRRIAAFAARENIPVITLLDPFREFTESNGALLHGFDGRGTGHWNRQGHRLAGNIIANRLCNSGRNALTARENTVAPATTQ